MIKLTIKTNKSALSKLINIERASIDVAINFQQSLSKQILTFLKNFISNIETDSIFSDEINEFLADTSFYLKKINSNISLYNDLQKMLNDIKSSYSQTEYEANITKVNIYNKKCKSYSNKICKTNLDIENFIYYMTSIDISEYISIEDCDSINIPDVTHNVKSTEKTISSNTTNLKTIKNEDTNSLIENTLTISEVTGLVTLPYKISDLKDFLHNEPDKYSSLSDVVLAKYTVPIKNYKFSAIARFREAYKLIIERENGTKKQAINLATELFSNYNLHPAIITACKDLNELDIYLSCLEFNELEDFHSFNIVYDVLPVQTKHAFLNG
ncbi:MAG: hypothetical protein ACI4VQ_05640 [Clostridia bacterium]